MNERKSFGLRLKAIRKQRRLTQEQLAQILDRSVDSVSNMERGVNLPNFETLRRIAEKLEVPIEALSERMGGDMSEEDKERMWLESTLADIARNLDTWSLRVAVEQFQALARHVRR